MRFNEIPFETLKRNKVPKPWDLYVIEKIRFTENFDKIIEGHGLLKSMAMPAARKEVAKSIYSNNREPNLLDQKFKIKEVMGSVGEALTELLLPGIDVSVNNGGFDVNFCGNYIEVKSTVEQKVTLSNIQYEIADYLIVHKFHKETGKYYSSLLVPLFVLRAFKPDRNRSVSVSTQTDVWARGLNITLERIVAYFYSLKNIHVGCTMSPCTKCHPVIMAQGKLDVKYLTLTCKGCAWENWESRCIYYISKYLKHSRPKSIENIDRDSGFSNYYFCVIERDGKRSISNAAPIRVISSGSKFGIHYCPSMYPTRKAQHKETFVVYDFTKIMTFMKGILDNNEKIMEFEVSIESEKVKCMVRSNLAPLKPGYYSETHQIAIAPDLVKKAAREITLIYEALNPKTGQGN